MTRRSGRRVGHRSGILAVAMVFATSVGTPAVAAGQASAPVSNVGRWELGLSATALGAMPLGAASADLTTPGGAPFPLFEATSRFAPGFGAEFQIARVLSSRVHVAGVATWTRADIETRITGDAEEVADARLLNRASRVSAEGAVSIDLAARDRRAFYVLAGAGWMRELPGGVVFGANGGIGKLGVGMKYWWRRPQPDTSRFTPAQSRRKRAIGVRIEARAVARYPGVVFGSSRVRVAPGLLAGLIFGR